MVHLVECLVIYLKDQTTPYFQLCMCILVSVNFDNLRLQSFQRQNIIFGIGSILGKHLIYDNSMPCVVESGEVHSGLTPFLVEIERLFPIDPRLK